MADKKISELTSISGANVNDNNDAIAIVDSSVGKTKKITRSELFKDVGGATFSDDILLVGNNSGNGSIRWELSDYPEDVRMVPFGPLGTLNVVADNGGSDEKKYNFASDGNESSLTVLRHGDIERGSNSNGEYVRFPDGTQICLQGVGSSNTTSETTWVFPAAFKAGTTPRLIVSPGASAGASRTATWSTLSHTSANYSIFDSTGSRQSTYHLIAIGSWY